MDSSLRSNTLWQEVDKIMNSPVIKPIAGVFAELHVLDKKVNVEAIKVLNLDIERDYENNFADVVSVALVFPAGTYADWIHPYKEKLEITLETVMTKLTGGLGPDYETTKVFTRYIAKVIDGSDPRASEEGANKATTDELDISKFSVVAFQCVEKAVHSLRVAQVGTVARKTTVKDLMQTLLTQQLSITDVPPEEKIIGMDIIEPDNCMEHEQILIPHGTPLIDVPEFLQTKAVGIYTKGLGNYIQSKSWYVYPRHDLDRNPTSSRSVTIIVLPPKALPTTERSYRKYGDHWIILTTGIVNLVNNSNNEQLNSVSGARTAHPDAILGPEHSVKDGNKAHIDPKVQVSTRENILPDGLKNIPFLKSFFTQNNFNIESIISGKMGGMVSCKWENSYPVAIEPGTLAKVLFPNDHGTVYELKGSILKAHHSTRISNKGLVENDWMTNTGLFVYVEGNLDYTKRPEPVATGPDKGAVGWMSGAGAPPKANTVTREGSNRIPNLSLNDIFGRIFK